MMVQVRCDFCGADDTTLVFQTTDTNYHREGSLPWPMGNMVRRILRTLLRKE